jgi:hypothetical protein
MAFTRSGVRSPSPPWPPRPFDLESKGRCAAAGRALKSSPLRGNSSVGRAQPCQGWGRGFESRFPLYEAESTLRLTMYGPDGPPPGESIGRRRRNSEAEPRLRLISYRPQARLVEYRSGSTESEAHVAGWSSLVARRAHNPEVVGSNPTPAMEDGEGGEDGLLRPLRPPTRAVSSVG